MSWYGYWKDITLTYNGQVIGGFPNFRSLKEGSTFYLPDGSPLQVFWCTNYGDQGLKINYNGRPIRGSSGDPETKLKGIFILACVIGGLNFIIGAIGQFGHSEFLEQIGAGWGLMVIGTLLAGLGYLAMSMKSVVALASIIVLLSADILLTLMLTSGSGRRLPITGIGIKIIFIIQFARGFRAIREYKELKRDEERNALNSFNPPDSFAN